MALRTHLLVKNNEKTIEKTLKSLIPLGGEIVVGNLGCRDNTLNICERYGAQIIDIGKKQSRSEIRNSLIGDEWNLWLHPWEVLIRGHDQIREPKKKGAFYVQIFQGSIITKEIRYWNGEFKFVNPAYETITAKDAIELPEAIVFAADAPNDKEEISKIVDEWRQREPTSNDPYYYQAFVYLEDKNYSAFANYANEYLIRESTSQAAIMLRYYLSQIQLYVQNNPKQATRNIMACITAHPLMAEFWCLLGDILYKQKKYDKAQSMYENALVLGTKRSNKDHWPIDIPKYREYPEKMLNNIAQMTQQVRLFEKRL